MIWLWTWKGESFGYRRNDELRLRNGTHVASFCDEKIYDFEANYLGEIRNSNRLITKKSLKGTKGKKTSKKTKLIGQVGRVNLVGLVNLVGYEDFPNPDSFQD
jgi:hypothetical protein